MNKPLFSHRPPSTGIHLLSDPLPEFIASSFPEGPAEIPAPPKRATTPARGRKARTRT